MLEDGRRRIFVLIYTRRGTVLRGEGANVDECSYPLVGTGRCNDSAAIRMANEDDRAGGAGKRRSYRGRVIGDSVKGRPRDGLNSALHSGYQPGAFRIVRQQR